MLVMRVIVRFFAGARERLGLSAEDIDLPFGATVGELILHLSRAHGTDLTALPLSYAVNGAYVTENTILKDGDEVGVLYPASGG